MLSMLVGGEPLGLPGTVVDSVEFQRASEGHPLDDVIVHSHDFLGNPPVIFTSSFSPYGIGEGPLYANQAECSRSKRLT